MNRPATSPAFWWTTAALVAAAVVIASGGCSDHRGRHATACGPYALATVYAGLGDRTSPAEVSREITRPGLGTAARFLCGTIRPEGFSITWPGEVTANVRRHGLEASPLSTASWDFPRPGVLLLAHPRDPLNWHWTATPASEDERCTYARWRVVRGWEITK